MTKQTKYSTIILILMGLAIGAWVVFHFTEPSEAQVVPYKERAITSLRDLNNVLVEIAETVSPTVVTISTEKILKTRQSPGFSFPFFRDPFREFFGDDFFGPHQKRRESPKREFRQQGLGSGVIVSEDGYILTNNHVIARADTINIRTIDNRTFEAKVVGTDPRTDIAIIKVEADNLPAIKQGNSDTLRVGEWVLAIGSPLSSNLAHTVTQGIVSAKGRSNVGLADYEDFIQTDAAINPGNSGGALINLDGELVGINTAIASRSGGFQGIGFAVPINMARGVMESLIEHGKVVRGWLGVAIQNINETMAKAMDLKSTDGALVGDVIDNSPADKAGFKPGDIIIELDGKKVKNTTQLRNNVAAITPGTTVDLKILRDGGEKTVEVKLGELPSDGAAPEVEQKQEELLGFTVSPINKELAQKYDLNPKLKGVVVTDIDQGSSAFRAGLREGDLIRLVNRKQVQNIEEFNQVLKGVEKGDTVLFQIVRRTGSFFLAFEL